MSQMPYRGRPFPFLFTVRRVRVLSRNNSRRTRRQNPSGEAPKPNHSYPSMPAAMAGGTGGAGGGGGRALDCRSFWKAGAFESASAPSREFHGTPPPVLWVSPFLPLVPAELRCELRCWCCFPRLQMRLWQGISIARAFTPSFCTPTRPLTSGHSEVGAHLTSLPLLLL